MDNNYCLLIVNLNTLTSQVVGTRPGIEGKVEFESCNIVMRLKVKKDRLEEVKQHIARTWSFQLEHKVSFVENELVDLPVRNLQA